MEHIGSIGMVILCLLNSRIASSQSLRTTSAPSFDVRLTDGPTAAEGLVEVSQSQSGEWGTICDYNLNKKVASVVCRQLGYDLALSINDVILGDGRSYGNRAIISQIKCRGIETSLTQCYTVKNKYPYPCTYSSVRCGNFTEPFDIRLVDGPTSAEGRLEVHHQGIWGTVCDDGFELQEANAACQQLGYDYAVEVKDEAFYGQGDGNILLDDIECIGNEKLLSRCRLRGWGSHDCAPSEDVGISCGYLEAGEIPVSLTDSESEKRGNVQVFFNGSWGYICRTEPYWDLNVASNWGIKEANVACFQLGYEGGARSYSDYRATYHEDTLFVVLGIDCIGDELTLGQCKLQGFDDSYSVTYLDQCSYNQASVICKTQVEGDLSKGKIAGIAVTCILLVIMLVVIPLVIFRCKKPKTIQSQTAENQQQANGTGNGTTTNGMPSSGVLSPAGETTVMYMSSPTGPPQVMMPYGSPAVAYGQNGNIIYQNQPLLVQQPNNYQPQIIAAPVYPSGVQSVSSTGSFADSTISTPGNQISAVPETGAAAADGGPGGGLGPNEHATEDKVPLV